MERKFDSILALDSREQFSRFQSLVDELIASGAVSNIQAFVARVIGEEVTQQVSKQVILYVVSILQNIGGYDFEAIANFIITSTKNHIVSHDEAIYNLREHLHKYYLSCGSFKDAAQILAGINMDSTSHVISSTDKANIYVRCAECFLQDDEAVDAEVFVNKASAFMGDVTDRRLQLRYRATNARVLDANRKFIEAALRYYDLSNAIDEGIVPEDLLELMAKAITCAVLGKAGPQRSRVMQLLFKDERMHSLAHVPKYMAHSALLSKMCNDQLIQGDETTKFQQSLLPHQLALTQDGLTIPEKAIIEHNMLAVSILYDNIKMSELAVLLKLTESRTEKIAAKMITEGRLQASIDQTEGYLHFSIDQDNLHLWDVAINNVCKEVSECVEIINNIAVNMSV